MSNVKIALDGPGGAGKSSVAKAVAARLGIVYVDTGAMYRTIGLYVKNNGIDPEDGEAVAACLSEITLRLSVDGGRQTLFLNGEAVGDEIRTSEISMYASRVSAIPAVREFLLSTQRRVAEEATVIMDGRDIGTVIFPDAEVKIFLTASPEARARRRYEELLAKGQDVCYEDVLNQMNERDHNDSTREIAPLRPAEDAVILDTSELDFNASVASVMDIIREKTAPKAPKMSRPYRFLHRIAAGLIRFLLRIKISGKENVPRDGGYVVCSNHISLIDVFTLGASFPRQLRFLAKRELFKVPVLAPVIRSLGAVSVDRGGSDVGALKRSIAIARGGELFALFPQGHRYPKVNPANTPIKSGVGMVAYRAGVGVIPVCIQIKKQKYRIFRRVNVIIGKPLGWRELGFVNGGNEEYVRAAEVAFSTVCRLGGYEQTEAKELNA